MTRTSARAKKSKQDVNKKKEDAKQLDENQTDSEGAGESTDKENDSTNYDVEKITHTRILKGKRQYLVRWKGYTEDSDTWETESALQSCKDVLEAFKKEHLTEANSDDESEEEAEIKGRTKGKKVAKNVKKNSTKSGKSSKQKIENEDSDIATEEELEEEKETKEVKEKITKKVPKGKKRKSAKGSESSKAKKSKTDESDDESVENEDSVIVTEEEPDEEGTKEVKAKNKGKCLSETEESDVDNKEKRKKKEPKGKKGKPVKETESSKAKKARKDESDDESVTDGKDYEVEKILEVHTRKDGSHEFLIRWKGYKPSDDTWEPEAHLDCQELIEKFMEKVDRAKDFTKKELRQRTETKRFVPLSTKRITHQRNSGLRPCYQETYED